MIRKIYSNTKQEKDIVKNRLNVINSIENKLTKEKEQLLNLDKCLNYSLKKTETNLKNLKGIENRLYYYIYVLGVNVTQAIDRVSIEYDKSSSTIWKYYYPKLKESLAKVQ